MQHSHTPPPTGIPSPLIRGGYDLTPDGGWLAQGPTCRSLSMLAPPLPRMRPDRALTSNICLSTVGLLYEARYAVGAGCTVDKIRSGGGRAEA